MSIITTAEQLEFVVFCIENTAIRLKMSGAEVYRMLTEETDLLRSYIAPNYDILHTQGKEYIVDDILSVMRGRGLNV